MKSILGFLFKMVQHMGIEVTFSAHLVNLNLCGCRMNSDDKEVVAGELYSEKLLENS